MPVSDKLDLKIVFIGGFGAGKRTIIDLLLGLKSLPVITKKPILSVMKKGQLSTPSDVYNALLISSTPGLIETGKHDSFIQNANLFVFVVINFHEMLACKKMIGKLKEFSPDANFCVIANKQDLEKTLDPTAAMKFLELPTIGISAIMPEHREALINFLNEFLQ